MNVRILNNGDQAAVDAFLSGHLESSMFLLSNMRRAGLINERESYQGTWAAAFENDSIVSVASHFQIGNLILQTPTYQNEILDTLFSKSSRPLQGMLGPTDQVTSAIELLALATDVERIQLDSFEGLYRLSLDKMVTPPALTRKEVDARPLSQPDIAEYIDLLAAYKVEATGHQDSPALRKQIRAEIDRDASTSNRWILKAKGQIISCCNFNASVAEAVQLGGVYTLSQHRNKGYSRCIVAAALQDARQRGVKLAILFTGNDNLPAIKSYTRLGFTRVGDYRLFLLKTSLNN